MEVPVRRPPPDPVHRWRLLARVRGRATAARPGARRRVRRVERRRRGRLGGRRAPRGSLGRRGHRGARPGGVLRLPGQPAQGHARRRPAAHRLAHHPHPRGARDRLRVAGRRPPSRASSPRPAGGRSRSSCWSTPNGWASRRSSRSAPCWPTCRIPARSPSPRPPTTRTSCTGSTSSRAGTRGRPASSASSPTPPTGPACRG